MLMLILDAIDLHSICGGWLKIVLSGLYLRNVLAASLLLEFQEFGQHWREDEEDRS